MTITKTNAMIKCMHLKQLRRKTSGYATWFTAGGAIRITHDDVITRKV